MNDQPSLNCSDDRARKAATAYLEKCDTVKEAVRCVANGFKARVKQQLLDYYTHMVGQWQKKCEEQPGRTSPYSFWPLKSNMGRFAYMANRNTISVVSRFLETSHRPVAEVLALATSDDRLNEQLRHSLKVNWQEIAHNKAEKEAEDAIQGFITKMTAKLFGILDAKGDFEAVTVTGTLGQNTLFFSFTDGSCFTLTNDIIIKTSPLGKVHNQYPTRFSKVTLRGAHDLRGISEAWMKKNFK